MIDICEAILELSKLKEDTDMLTLNVEVLIEQGIKEKLPSGVNKTIYDDQVLEDWSTFTGNIEEIIETENDFDLINVAHSTKGNKLSTYYNFFITDENDKPIKECVINLRVSDHPSNTAIKSNRKRHLTNLMKELDINNYRLYGIIVNDKQYDTYDDALKAIRKILDNVKEN